MTLVTEKEASEMWCPLARVQGKGASYNRHDLEDGSAFDVPVAAPCIGTLCMAWRDAVFPHQLNLPESERTQGVGYCGAFGKVRS